MFQDKDEELKRLEEALLAEEEEPEEETDGEETILFQPVTESAPVKAYNTDILDTDLETFSREVESGSGITGLVILAIALTAGIVCAVIWWVLRLRGII